MRATRQSRDQLEVMRSAEQIVVRKFQQLAGVVDERARRLWAAAEANSLGTGGAALVCRATGLDPKTVRKGQWEFRQFSRHPPSAKARGRVRRPGGGRKPLRKTDPTLVRDLRRVLQGSVAGDPQSRIRWTSKSIRHLRDELVRLGHALSRETVHRELKRLHFSLQGGRKQLEGTPNPHRNEQFRIIDRKVASFERRGQPIISVDTKKKELVGNFRNSGREWRPAGDPEIVRVHDFPSLGIGKAIPYAAFDLERDEAWVSVGVDHDTAEFAVESIRRWWQHMGQSVYAEARELLILADAGGSNGPTQRLWKKCLQHLADETGLKIRVSHYPPGTSKWNPVEHSVFSYVSINWRGRPLRTYSTIVSLLNHTTTRQGLKINAKLDHGKYPLHLKVSDEEMTTLKLAHDKALGEWNYCLTPRPLPST
jgi:hypothetical protein